ncbi:DUF6629 family protein [Sphingomonas canadensis]|uniref:DUF6629 family protein n=1 Tax=Sphingomonas canadensis TaxID=1219257 RepID=A0ABW3H8E8_9SPHN|nr:DUF6629 family protein [Sphingomonas canadensis]MCW3837320.1 hypothetical protein [Sphingomonas canadensis]
MCLSAEVSFAAAAILVPTGVVSTYKAARTDWRYVPICALPFLFGVQQLFEGLVWTSGEAGDLTAISRYSLAYMFFSWLAWPVWVPMAVWFLEPVRRKPLYLGFVILGAIFGGGQYLPYAVHQEWLTVTFLPHAIAYGGIELFDFLLAREWTYSIYVLAVVVPLLVASRPEIRVFGVLVATVLAITYLFFRFAYVSAFCFGGALVSIYLVGMIFWKGRRSAQGRELERGEDAIASDPAGSATAHAPGDLPR